LFPRTCAFQTKSSTQGLAYFEDYFWRAIALVWPASKDRRGKPDPKRELEQVDPSSPSPSSPALVFETFKAEWATDWDVPDDLPTNRDELRFQLRPVILPHIDDLSGRAFHCRSARVNAS
jgi:hypothetical protein